MEKVIFITNRDTVQNEAWKIDIYNFCDYFEGRIIFFTKNQKELFKNEKGRSSFKTSLFGILCFYLYSIWSVRNANVVFIEDQFFKKLGKRFLLFGILHIVDLRKLVYRFSKKDLPYISQKETDRFFTKIASRLRFIITPDEESERYLKQERKLKNVAMVVGIRNSGLHLQQTLDIKQDGKFELAMLSCPDADSLFYEKGILDLLEVMKSFQEKRIPISLSLFWRRDNTQLILELIAKKGIRNIKVRSGFVNVAKEISEHHAVIFAPRTLYKSRHWPTSIMESITFKRPVIVSNILEISRIISQYELGVVVDENNQNLEKQIIELKSSYQKYIENINGYKFHHFDIFQNIKKMEHQLFLKD